VKHSQCPCRIWPAWPEFLKIPTICAYAPLCSWLALIPTSIKALWAGALHLRPQAPTSVHRMT